MSKKEKQAHSPFVTVMNNLVCTQLNLNTQIIPDSKRKVTVTSLEEVEPCMVVPQYLQGIESWIPLGPLWHRYQSLDMLKFTIEK